MLILHIVVIIIVMTGLLFVMNFLAKTERLNWAFFVLGIEFMLLAMLLVNLFKYSIIFFVLFVIYIILVCLIGRINYYKLKIKEIDLEVEELEENITIGYIADFQFDKHSRSYNKKASKALNKKVNEQNFDILLMGGDYINYQNHLPIFTEHLKEMSSKNKTYSVFGNHDHLWKYEMKEDMDELGIKSLENEYEVVQIKNNKIVLIGLEDYWTGAPEFPQIPKEYEKLPKILLIHNPDTINVLKDEKYDLALAGHYHKGQVNFIPGVHIARIITKYVYGLFDIGTNKMFVTSGVGGTFMRGYISGYIRWNAPPEIVKINLTKKK